MNALTLVIGVPVLLAGAFGLWWQRGRSVIDPVTIFLLVNVLGFVALLPHLNAGRASDVEYAVVYLLGIVGFTAGAVFRSYDRRGSSVPRRWSEIRATVHEGPTLLLFLVLVGLLGVFATAFYYLALGYNLFLESILSYARYGSGVEDISSLRLAAYSSGSTYLAPGYVNQFKNTLLPMIALALLGRRIIGLRRPRWHTLVVVGVVVGIALLGTGQRGPFIVAVVAGLVFLSTISGGRKTWARVSLAVGAIGFILAATLFLGRTTTQWTGIQTPLSLTAELWHRVFIVQQRDSLFAFSVVHSMPLQLGKEWAEGLVRLLPFTTPGTPIAHQIFYEAFGSFRGTMPLSIWGSAWHNWGTAGVPIFGLLLGMLYQSISIRLFKGSKDLWRLAGYAFLSVILGTWVVGGPAQVINNGALSAALYLLLLRIMRRVPSSSPLAAVTT